MTFLVASSESESDDSSSEDSDSKMKVDKPAAKAKSKPASSDSESDHSSSDSESEIGLYYSRSVLNPLLLTCFFREKGCNSKNIPIEALRKGLSIFCQVFKQNAHVWRWEEWWLQLINRHGKSETQFSDQSELLISLYSFTFFQIPPTAINKMHTHFQDGDWQAAIERFKASVALPKELVITGLDETRKTKKKGEIKEKKTHPRPQRQSWKMKINTNH